MSLPRQEGAGAAVRVLRPAQVGGGQGGGQDAGAAQAGAPRSACSGRCQCVGKEAAVAAVPFAHRSTAALCFCGGWGFFHEHSWLLLPFRLTPCRQKWSSPQVSSPNPTFQCPAPVRTTTLVSGWGVQDRGTDHPCRSHSVLPVTDWLLHFPLSPRSSPSVPSDLPTGEGISPGVRTSPLLQLPSKGTCPVPLPLFFFMSFILPGYMGIFLVLSGV